MTVDAPALPQKPVEPDEPDPQNRKRPPEADDIHRAKPATEGSGPPDDEPVQEATPVPPRVTESLFGYAFHEFATHGPAAFGDGSSAVTNIYAGDATYQPPSRSERQDVTRRLEAYAPAPADAGLRQLLAERYVVCLAGRVGTGRMTTAFAALARHHGTDEIHELHLPPGLDALALKRDPTLLKQHRGHVLRLPNGDPVPVIRQLEGVFRERKASLVLIHGIKASDGEPAAGIQMHRRVRPSAAFARHLCRLLECRCLRDYPADADCRHRYVRQLLADQRLHIGLDQMYRLGEVVDFATRVASEPPDVDRAIAHLAASQPQRRRRAAGILLSNRGGTVGWRHHRNAQYERAFRIAYAVFDREPMEYVFHSTGLLLDELDRESGGATQGRAAMEHGVHELLGDMLALEWTGAQEDAPVRAGWSRTAFLRDSRMRGAILDVAWHDLDNSRPAVLRWLRALANDGRQPVRIAAAHAAGLLTHYDFDLVYGALIDGWAADPRPRVRQLAAWATELAARGGEVTDLVLAKVHTWVLTNGAYCRDTAARFHASGFGRLIPGVLGRQGWILGDLRRIATDDLQRRMPTISAAIDAMYRPSEAVPTVSALAEWASNRDTRVQTHAARTLVRLAIRDVDRRGGPSLLADTARTPEAGRALAALWSVALLLPETARSAWSLLGMWLHRADDDPALRGSMSALLGLLSERSSLSRRLDFYLPRLWRELRPDEPLPSWIRRSSEGE